MSDTNLGAQRFSLGRWSRMKRAAARELAAPAADASTAPGTADGPGGGPLPASADALATPADANRDQPAAMRSAAASEVHPTSQLPTDVHAASGPATQPIPAGTQGTANAGERPAPDAPSSAAKLPPIESLNRDSDFTGFMKRDVDPALQRAALRKLFSDPHFNVMDGLDTYIDDYTKPDPISPDVFAQLAHARAIFAPAAGEEEKARPPDLVADAHQQNVAELQGGDDTSMVVPEASTSPQAVADTRDDSSSSAALPARASTRDESASQ